MYDVVIVGGAAVGSATAFFTAASPHFDGSVLVIERDSTYARSATALSASSIRHQFSNEINVKMSQFGTEFIRNFASYVSIGDEIPEIGFKENGYLLLASNIAGRKLLERNHLVQCACGAEVSMLEPNALADRFSWLRVQDLAIGSFGERGEGWFDSASLLQGLRRKAQSLGVEFIKDEVVALKQVGNRIESVMTSSKQEIECGIVVNASGTRGKLVAKMAGLDIPVEPRRRTLFVVSCPVPLQGKVPLTVDPTGVFFRPEGQYFITGTSPRIDPEVDPNDFDVMHSEFEEEVWPVLAARVPAFEALRVVSAWAGHYDYCTLDQNAIIGPHPQIRNFMFANGFSGHGLQQSPAVGRALSELVIYGSYRTIDLSPLSYARVIANNPFPEESVI